MPTNSPTPAAPVRERPILFSGEPRYLTLAEIQAWQHEHAAGNYIPAHVMRALFRTAQQLYAQRGALAKLAAKEPQFFNPINAWEAEAVRDAVLVHPDEIYTTEARAHV